jgi:xanthine dehydrogenase molybdenum-binding subunit
MWYGNLSELPNGQLHGARSRGPDTAIFEGGMLDPSTGRMVNCNMIDYKWRPFNDLPLFDNMFTETPIPSHRFHAVGVGEISILHPAPVPYSCVTTLSG